MRFSGFLLVLLFSGCLSVEDTRGLPPFWEIYDEPDGSKEYVFRPLGGVRVGANQTRTRILWPLMLFSTSKERDRVWLLPIFYHQRRTTMEGKEDVDYALFPLVFTGTSPKEGSYFALFPIGGVLKGLLGQDYITFVLFPLFWRQRDRDRVSYHVLWPIVNWLRGETRKGWRFWPLFGDYQGWTEEGEAKYRRRFILWPLIHIQENNLDTRNPTHFFMVFPFYGRIKSPRFVKTTHMWPLFFRPDMLQEIPFAGGSFRTPGEKSSGWPSLGSARGHESRAKADPGGHDR